MPEDVVSIFSLALGAAVVIAAMGGYLATLYWQHEEAKRCKAPPQCPLCGCNLYPVQVCTLPGAAAPTVPAGAKWVCRSSRHGFAARDWVFFADPVEKPEPLDEL